MNADKKFGILIGLVLIFIFVFVIGKVPSLRHEEEGPESTPTLMTPQTDPYGLAARERDAQEALDQFRPKPESVLTADNDADTHAENPDTNAEVRIILPLPETTEPLISPVGPAVPRQTPQATDVQPLPDLAWPKAYVVHPGDNLALIAKRFYGPAEGNRIRTINRLFQANRRLLHRPDQIQVGQKLVIPAPHSVASKALEAITVPVKSVGTPTPRKTPNPQPPHQAQGRWYTVRDGDNLWKIASAQLGNGERYTEIARLNSAIIEDEDRLPVGLRIKLPVL